MALKIQNSSSSIGSRILLIVLLVASLLLVVLYAVEGATGPLHTVQNAASTFSSPFKYVSGAIGAGADAAGTAASNATASGDTLDTLREQNQELRSQVSQMEEYRQEAQRLQALLDIKDTYKFDAVGARVISRSTNAWEQEMTLDKGTNDGIANGMPVMGTSGLVGQVVSTTPFTSEVRLLTDPQSGVAAFVQSSRAEGIVRGSLEGLLYLDDISSDAKVEVGDVIVTSGLGGNYYRGIIIGQVVRIDQTSSGAARKIVVAPNDQTAPLEEVFVATKMNSEGAAAPDFKGNNQTDGSQTDGGQSGNSQPDADSSGIGTAE